MVTTKANIKLQYIALLSLRMQGMLKLYITWTLVLQLPISTGLQVQGIQNKFAVYLVSFINRLLITY